MKLEQQVVSLELAKELKELGVKQESLFYWRLGYHVSESFNNGVSLGKIGIFSDEYELQYLPHPRYRTADVKWNESDLSKLNETEVSAFTVAELGEILPRETSSFKRDNWVCRLEGGKWNEMGDTEADARAEMLVYLVKNNLITLQ